MAFHDPVFPNPYPKAYAGEPITNFKYETPLILRREAKAIQGIGRGEPDYIVAEPYTVSFDLDGQVRTVTVPKGMLTDLVSVPRAARSIVGKVGRHLEGAIIHDFLSIAWQHVNGRGALRSDRRFADDLMLAAMKAAKVGRFKRSLIHGTLRILGWCMYKSPDSNRYVVLPNGE